MNPTDVAWLKFQLRVWTFTERTLAALYAVRGYFRPALASLAAGFALGLVLALI
jgi:hypothetical protein